MEQGLRVWLVSEEQPRLLEEFRDALGLTVPILWDADQVILSTFQRQMAFPTGAFPHQYVIGVDGTIVYYNNRFEYENVVGVIEAELAKQ